MQFLLRTFVPLAILAVLGMPAFSQDLLVNNGFELRTWDYWVPTGNDPIRFVIAFDTAHHDVRSFSYGQGVWDGVHGGLAQAVHVQAGTTYSVKANVAYYLC